MTKADQRGTVFFIYLTTFLATISYAFILYINSSFLKKFIAEGYLGLLYGTGSTIALIFLVNISTILKKFGHFKTMLAIILLESGSIFGSSLIDIAKNRQEITAEQAGTMYLPIFAMMAFLSFFTTAILLRFSLDLYLEKFSKDESTGKTRGLFLTTINIAIAISPFLVGKILSNGEFWKVYMTSALIFLPAIAITIFKLKNVHDVEYHETPFLIGLKKLWKNKNIYGIFMSNFLLEFFYSWMTIYTPIYLNSIMGFSWENIGTMFSIMLTSFVILQIPLGRIADRYLGEKEILTAGFIIAGTSTIYLSFIDKPDFILWAAVMFMTRVGAAAIEIMNETYFFKKVSAKDSDIMGFYRNASPLAYIVAPTLASVFLYFFDFKYLFAALGIIMLWGVRYSLSIKDTL